MSLYDKLRRVPGLKQLLPEQIRFPGRSTIFFDFKGPDLDVMARDVGDGTGADVLMTPIRWLQKALREAPIQVLDSDGEPLEGNALTDLLARPNPAYPWDTLLDGTALSLSLDGNAYWLVARNIQGDPVELWYAPHTNVEPKWPADDSTVWIEYYEYTVQGAVQKLAPEDVIHFRDGVDLDNIRKGLSPLKGLLREVWTDNEAAAFTASLLRNKGIPGVVISPTDPDVQIDRDAADAIEATIDTKVTGSGRGRTIVMTGPTRVDQFGFSPKELDLSPLRDISEERVTAALGVQSAVVGFGSGLQQTKVGATMRELRQLSWFNGVIPMQGTIAGELTRMLAQPFNAGAVDFNNNGVEALRENEDTKAARLGKLYRDGVITRAEARAPLGQETDPTDEVYLVQLTQAFIPQGTDVSGLIPTITGTGTRAVTGTVTATPEELEGNGKARRLDPDELEAAIEKVRQATGAVPDLWLTPAGIVAVKQHQHSPAEMAIIDAAPSANTTEATRKLATELDRLKRTAAAGFQQPLEQVFEDLGDDAFEAASRLIGATEERDDGAGELKQDELSPEDRALAQAIDDAIDTDRAQRALSETLAEGYLEVALKVTAAAGEALGIDFEIPDAVQREVMQAGGLRAGLVDLDQQTKDAIFDALESGRAEGLTADNLARHIREHVEAGPWRDRMTRARVISRTEGANAANVSTIATAKAMPLTEHVQVFDNRTGFDDPICSEANGKVITIQEAEAIGLAHPNCTRSFVPVNAVLLEEMGL
ncbi:MAG: phage portal protein [Proteobacteria bacterium]|nr:phage portal protein [Pseudomonadota bacterium]